MTKTFKRFISAMLALSMLLSFTAIGYATEGDSGESPLPSSTAAIVSSTSVNAGESARLTVSADSSYVFSDYTIKVTYDPTYLTVIDVTTENAGTLDHSENTPGLVNVTYTAPVSSNGASGELFTIVFDVKKAASSDAKISVSGEAYSKGGNSITITKGEGVISIAPAEYTVNFTITGKGSATAEKQSYKANEIVNITATPESGYEFSNWSTTSTRIENTTSSSTSFTMPSANVNINVYFKEIPTVPTHNITLTQVEGGTISSDVSAAPTDEKVTLTATPNAGYRFKSWKVTQGNITLQATSAPLTFFTMKSSDVSITAEFEKVPAGNFTLTIYSDNGKLVSGSNSYYTSGQTVRIKAENSTEYYFDSWVSEDGSVTFSNAKDIETTFVMPAKDTVIRAKYTNKPRAKYQLIILVEGMGTATTVSNEYYFNEGDKVNIVATPSLGYYFYGWSNMGSGVHFLNSSGMSTNFTMPGKNLTIKAMFATTLLGGVTGSTGSSSSGSAAGTTTLPSTPEGTYLVSFNTGGGTYIADVTVSAGQTVSRPTVTPELSGYTFAGWYSDPSYSSQFNFSSPINSHTTIYAKWENTAQQPTSSTQSFSDVKSTDWFYSYVTSLASKQIINGMGNNKFAPQNNITRAQFITILANLANADLSSYSSSEFSDVKTSDWFAKQVAWAKAKGIAGGNNGKFSPNANISRQDMAVMIKRYADSIALTLPATTAATTFADATSISSYAKDAVNAMQTAGIIGGKNGNRFDPLANATRAEASKMIYVLLSIIG